MEKVKRHTLLTLRSLMLSLVVFGLLFGVCLPQIKQGSPLQAETWAQTGSNTGFESSTLSLCFFKTQKVLAHYSHFFPDVAFFSSDYFSNRRAWYNKNFPKAVQDISFSVKERLSFTCQLLI